ncbi:MAG: hypothetical protein WBP61_02455, partial [Nocardioides sp.]
MARTRTHARARSTLVQGVVLSLVVATMAVAAGLLSAAPAQAAHPATASTPDLQLSGGPAASVLYGQDVPVTLTASLPAGEPKGYNLAYRAVLPAGTSYVAGSAGLDGEPRVLTNAPTAGSTTLIWLNLDDLVASSSHTLSFSVRYNDTDSAGTPTYDVGDTLPIASGAYISIDPRDEADFDSLGRPDGSGADTYTGWAEQSTDTGLTAIKIRKSEPHPEGEIPRGVHDHQTVYTLTITNNEVNPTTTVSVEDYLPAGLEFLGCVLPGAEDNTTAAPTNPGSSAEYPGSGPIEVTADGGTCVVPDLVETVDLDPDGSGPLPSGVYTHVKWDSIGDFAPDQVKELTYAAAIPIRENTVDWTTVGGAPATTGAQTANLDNNSGPETYDEQPLLNGATTAGTYQSPGKDGLAVSDQGTLLRTAEDIAIQKSNNNATLNQGDLTRWTIDLQVSEYRYVDDVVVHDVVPNGLCPLGGTNLTQSPNAQDAECDPVAGKGPSADYTTVQEQADGTFDLTWDTSTFPALARIQPSDTRQLTFWTRTRANYQSGFENSTPVLSRDSVRNEIDTRGLDFIRCAPGDPDCTTGGAKIDADETDGELDYDVSGSGKAASGPVIDKQVAATYPGDGNCNDLAAASYGETLPTYGPGDLVCWKLQLAFPQDLDTSSQDVFDILPNGIDYVAGSWQATTNNTVPISGFESADGRLTWSIGAGGTDVDAGGQVFEVTIETTVGSPLGHHSGDVEGNLQKFSYESTAGKAFTLRDKVDFQWAQPEVSLVKGVRQINSGTVNGPNVDHKQVAGSDVVQYRVDVTNNGPEPAQDVRVWDVLPTGITCAEVAAISDGGSCNSAADRVEWNASSDLDLAAGATTMLTYRVTVPAGVSPSQTFVNTAGVMEYGYETNRGTTTSMVPANTTVKDPALTPNTGAAQDVSDIYTADAKVVKGRTTSVNESGNNAGSEATIGEVIDYTVTTTIPKGTTIYGTPTV